MGHSAAKIGEGSTSEIPHGQRKSERLFNTRENSVNEFLVQCDHKWMADCLSSAQSHEKTIYNRSIACRSRLPSYCGNCFGKHKATDSRSGALARKGNHIVRSTLYFRVVRIETDNLDKLMLL